MTTGRKNPLECLIDLWRLMNFRPAVYSLFSFHFSTDHLCRERIPFSRFRNPSRKVAQKQLCPFTLSAKTERIFSQNFRIFNHAATFGSSELPGTFQSFYSTLLLPKIHRSSSCVPSYYKSTRSSWLSSRHAAAIDNHAL